MNTINSPTHNIWTAENILGFKSDIYINTHFRVISNKAQVSLPICHCPLNIKTGDLTYSFCQVFKYTQTYLSVTDLWTFAIGTLH